MRRVQNENTQPFIGMPVFQNWRVVAKAWFFACRSSTIAAGEAKSLNLCGQHVVLFRGEDGEVRALDGFCPHMGTDLGIGTVKGNRIACFFHHWEFDGDGVCRKVPCGEAAPDGACLRSYAVSEKYGAIWVFPDREAHFPVPDYEGHDGEEVVVAFGKSYERTCHHHVTMINGIDAQHLRTVHGFGIRMDLEIREETESALIDFSLSGELPVQSLKDRLLVRLVGPEYAYTMRYSAGSLGLLTMAQRLRLFGRFPLPSLRMIFAYRPIEFGRTLVQPIYVTKKRSGVWGKLKERFLLWITKRLFYSLRDEDGKVYDNMRFNPANLIDMDMPVAVFIKSINHLKPSIWSTCEREPVPEETSEAS